MNSYNSLLRNIVHKFNHRNVLQEGIEEIKKYFPKLEDKKLRELIALDPTYKGGEQLGKYGQWIIRLFYNNIKNMEREADYRELLKKFPDGKNPKTGQQFVPPTKLPEVKEEDLYKIKDSLKQYEMLKKQIGKPIDSFKTIAELDSAIGSIKDIGVPQDEKAIKRYELFKKAFNVGMKPVYEDKDFIVGWPATLKSSVIFGNDTRWCTTSPSGDMYNSYSKDGNLYIIMDKRNGDLFQFHPETESFMNEYDRRVDIEEFTENNPKVCKAIFDYKIKNEKTYKPTQLGDEFIMECIDKFKKCLKEPELFKEEILSEHECSDIKIENGNICFKMDFRYIGDVYRETGWYSSRDVIPDEIIIQILDGTYDSGDWYSDYNLDNQYSTITYMWDKLKGDFGITQSWDDIRELAEDNEDLENIINDDWYDDCGLLSVIDVAERNGSEMLLYDDIIKKLEDELPIDYKDPHEETLLNMKIPVDKLWTIFLSLKSGKEKLPDRLLSVDYKEFQPELKSDKPEFNPKDWFDSFKEPEKDYYFEEDWLKQYRDYYYDGPEFCITYNYYGYNDTDEDYLEEAFKDAMPRIKAVLDKNNKSEE